MTRYAVCIDGQWLAAVYDNSGPGIMLTSQAEDACSWVTHDRAVEAARLASQFFNSTAFIYHQNRSSQSSWEMSQSGASQWQ